MSSARHSLTALGACRSAGFLPKSLAQHKGLCERREPVGVARKGCLSVGSRQRCWCACRPCQPSRATSQAAGRPGDVDTLPTWGKKKSKGKKSKKSPSQPNGRPSSEDAARAEARVALGSACRLWGAGSEAPSPSPLRRRGARLLPGAAGAAESCLRSGEGERGCGDIYA